MQIARVFQKYESLIGTEIEVNGWVKTCRDQKKMVFIHLSDGTTQQTLQVVALPEHVPVAELSSITTGTSLYVKGILVASPAKGQKVELSARTIKIYQICSHDFPFQKVGLPLEFMRKFSHQRHRSNVMRAVFVVKSLIMKSIHDFFMQRSYQQVDIPVITTNACESGCQPLQVTSLLNDGKISSIPVKTIKKEVMLDKNSYLPLITGSNTAIRDVPTDDIDFSKDFFDRPVYLTVSNQLPLEAFALGLGYVYTITQASRGEPSQTTKHLATFSMLEYELCFSKLEDNMEISESVIKYCAKEIMEKCPEEIVVLEKAEAGLIGKLQRIINEPFVRFSHYAAVKLLRETHAVMPFVEEPKFDGDLAGEHERFLVKHFGQPVIVTHYPKAVKAFYMPVCETKEIDGQVIEYVDCFDLLMDIGEVVGGSQRIWDEKTLVERMVANGMDPKHLDWYVELRRYGSVPHGGAGVGIERLTAVLTGMANIKDCISFPITVHACDF